MRTRRVGTNARLDRTARTVLLLCLAALAVALLASSAWAQDAPAVEPFDLRGTVTDDAGQPLVGAFVALAGSDWGSVTNESGHFRLEDIDPGPIEITVEQLGYATLHWRGSVSADESLALTLEAQPVVLEGLTVVTDRFENRRRAIARSVQSYDRTALATSHYDDMIQFVRARAGLFETRCPRYEHSSVCFMRRGRPVAPVVYIDEMPVIGGTDFLAAIRPHELYMLEVYDRGAHIRAYTTQFMERAAKQRLQPVTILR